MYNRTTVCRKLVVKEHEGNKTKRKENKQIQSKEKLMNESALNPTHQVGER